MRKFIYLAALFLAFAAAQGTGRSSNKIQLVYREQADGRWQVSVYGTVCEDMMKMRLVEPPEPVIQPFVVECYHPEK